MAQPERLQAQGADNRSAKADAALTRSNAQEFVKPEPVTPAEPNIFTSTLANDTFMGTDGEVDIFIFDFRQLFGFDTIENFDSSDGDLLVFKGSLSDVTVLRDELNNSTEFLKIGIEVEQGPDGDFINKRVVSRVDFVNSEVSFANVVPFDTFII
jgi:hypothetical protein